MPDIRKTGSAKVHEREIRSQLDQLESDMLDRIKHGNIYEEFVKSIKFKLSDFQDYFSQQWQTWKGQVIQDEDMKAAEHSFHQCNIDDIAVQKKSCILKDEDREMLLDGMMSHLQRVSGKTRGAKVQKITGADQKGTKESADKKTADGAGSAEASEETSAAGGASAGGKTTTDSGDSASATSKQGAPTKEDLEDMAGGTLDEWDQFTTDAWNQIIDTQMAKDMQARYAEIKQEVDRIIALAKSGRIGAEFVLIALAKVNQTRNGVLISGLGKKAFHMNETMNNIADDLHSMDSSAPGYYSELQMAQSKTRDQNFQQNLVLQDMQKVMQDVASVLEQVHSMISEINQTRREIVSRLGAR
jgi:coenzyme F420-reducing hydrogenase delta subunit